MAAVTICSDFGAQENKICHCFPFSPFCLDFPDTSIGKESTCNVGDLGLIPGLGRSPGEGKGYPLQYSGLENSIQSTGSQRVGHDWATFTHWMRLEAMILVFWMLNFKPAFSVSSFTLLKRLLVPLCFLPLEWCHLHIWDCFSLQSWFQLVSLPAWHFAWCTLHIR